MKLEIIVLLFGFSFSASQKSYKNYKVYNVIPKSVTEMEFVESLSKKVGIEFWEDHVFVNQSTKVMVAPNEQIEYEMLVKDKVESVLVIEDVQKLIDNKESEQEPKCKTCRNVYYSFQGYHSLDEIYMWFDILIRTYPNIVSIVTMGKSFEGREIRGVILNFKGNENSSEKLIAMIEGGIHAREWISPATATWIINEFLTSNDPEIRSLADNFEWHIFPVVNPDGYSYTFTHNRMWRKNRNTAYSTSCEHLSVDDDMSNGIDLNRNFDIAWMTEGASSDPCSNTFAGPVAGSEPEARAMAEYVIDISREGNLIYYFALHSYTQLFVIPYSHFASVDEFEDGDNYDDMYKIALKGSQRAKRRYGTQYRVGLAVENMYQMSGTSFDYVKSAINVPLSYLFELRDMGNYGFLLPANQIIPVGLEVMDALVEMDQAAKILGYYSGAFANSCSIIVLMVCVAVAGLFN